MQRREELERQKEELRRMEQAKLRPFWSLNAGGGSNGCPCSFRAHIQEKNALIAKRSAEDTCQLSRMFVVQMRVLVVLIVLIG